MGQLWARQNIAFIASWTDPAPTVAAPLRQIRLAARSLWSGTADFALDAVLLPRGPQQSPGEGNSGRSDRAPAM